MTLQVTEKKKTSRAAFEGSVGTRRYLFDTETGAEIACIGETAQAAADRLRVKLVPRHDVAKPMWRALVRTWRNARAHTGQGVMRRASAERSSYGCGVVHRVINGVREAKLAGEAAVAATCRALVVRRLAEVDAHMAIAIPLRKVKKSRQVADRHYRQGWEDGKHVDLGMNKKCLPQGAA